MKTVFPLLLAALIFGVKMSLVSQASGHIHGQRQLDALSDIRASRFEPKALDSRELGVARTISYRLERGDNNSQRQRFHDASRREVMEQVDRRRAHQTTRSRMDSEMGSVSRNDLSDSRGREMRIQYGTNKRRVLDNRLDRLPTASGTRDPPVSRFRHIEAERSREFRASDRRISSTERIPPASSRSDSRREQRGRLLSSSSRTRASSASLSRRTESLSRDSAQEHARRDRQARESQVPTGRRSREDGSIGSGAGDRRRATGVTEDGQRRASRDRRDVMRERRSENRREREEGSRFRVGQEEDSSRIRTGAVRNRNRLERSFDLDNPHRREILSTRRRESRERANEDVRTRESRRRVQPAVDGRRQREAVDTEVRNRQERSRMPNRERMSRDEERRERIEGSSRRERRETHIVRDQQSGGRGHLERVDPNHAEPRASNRLGLERVRLFQLSAEKSRNIARMSRRDAEGHDTRRSRSASVEQERRFEERDVRARNGNEDRRQQVRDLGRQPMRSRSSTSFEERSQQPLLSRVDSRRDQRRQSAGHDAFGSRQEQVRVRSALEKRSDRRMEASRGLVDLDEASRQQQRRDGFRMMASKEDSQRNRRESGVPSERQQRDATRARREETNRSIRNLDQQRRALNKSGMVSASTRDADGRRDERRSSDRSKDDTRRAIVGETRIDAKLTREDDEAATAIRTQRDEVGLVVKRLTDTQRDSWGTPTHKTHSVDSNWNSWMAGGTTVVCGLLMWMTNTPISKHGIFAGF